MAGLLAEFAESQSVSFSFETAPYAIPAYYASMRFLKLPFFLDQVADEVVVTDIDVAFRSDPMSLFSSLEASEADLALRIYDRFRVVRETRPGGREIMRYPRIFPWAQINAACLAVRNTRYGHRAARQISEDMARHFAAVMASGRKAWWVDQNALFVSYQHMKTWSGLKILNVEEVGMPFGAFDYSQVRTLGSPAPF